MLTGTFLCGNVLWAQAPGGFGGPGEGEVKLVAKFDQNGDGWLNPAERKAARDYLAAEKAAGRGPRRPGPRGRPESQEPPTSGPKVNPADVKSFPGAPLYDPQTVRTLFLEFSNPDWEQELADFYGTDVEVPATLVVEGKKYPEVGVHFRGASSFFTVGEGRKRSLNLSLNFVHNDQRLEGYRTLNLLNSHTDPSFVRTILYHQVARAFLPAPKANYVRLVINGESWGPFINAQQVNRDFTKEWFGTTQGARWKVPGSPRGRGGLTYLGTNVADYRRIFEIKSKDEPAAWAALIDLCRVLNETPVEGLEAALAPRLNVDGVLRFLALENALINSDGYWIRASDYYLYRDLEGRFHIVPHDANETFRPPMGPGWGGGAGDGFSLDPLAGADDPNKPLLNRLLKVPAWRERYLGYLRQIAEQWLDWTKLEPLVRQHQALIADEIPGDVRKLYSTEAFAKSVAEDTVEPGPRGPRETPSLKSFVERRRAFLLSHPEVKDAPLPQSPAGPAPGSTSPKG